MKFTQNITLAAVAVLGVCGCALAGYAAPAYSAPATYAAPAYSAPVAYSAPAVYSAPAASYSAPAYASNAVYSPENAEAAASAITDIAAAKASAAKIDNVNFGALNAYGYQIGVPLLVRPYGPLTALYSALAPKRSFVGTIDAG